VRERVIEGLKAAGFPYVAVDLEGFRSGSLNETLRGRSSLTPLALLEGPGPAPSAAPDAPGERRSQ
jgi:hypothetical protein